MKIVINPQYEKLKEFIFNIPETFSKTGEVIYDERNQLRTFSVEGYDLIVKRFKKPLFVNRIVYTFFRLTKAKRSYHYALHLLKNEIITPSPIAFIEIKKNGLLHYSYYICIFEKEMIHIREQMEGKNIPAGFISDLAIFIADMHNKGILHKDLSPGNILFKSEKPHTIFSVIDINRMKFFDNIPKKLRYDSFRRISKNDDVIQSLAREYAKYCSFDETEATSTIAKYCSNFRIKS